jgi:thiol-disulfide isomerase/thioredoxin
MKKTFISLLAGASLLGLVGFGTAHAACNYTAEQIGNQLPFIMKGAKIYKQKEITPQVCSIIMQVQTPMGQSQFVPIFTLGDKGIIIGTLFQNKQNVTGTELMAIQQAASSKNFASVKNELNSIAMATYTPPKPNGKILYAFVDPLCPFCHMVEPKLQKLADESHYTVKIMPFIVHGQPAYDKAASFICSKLNFADYIKGDFGRANVCPQAKDLLTKAQKIDTKLGLSGTPTFFTSDGKMIVGANEVELKQVLGIIK